MGEVYNPESQWLEQLESLELQARRLRQKLQDATVAPDQQVIERQLRETEEAIRAARRRLKR